MANTASTSRSYALLGHIVTVVGVDIVESLSERLDELLGTGCAGLQSGSRTTLVVHREDAAWRLQDEFGEALCPPLRNAEQLAEFVEWLAYSAAIRHADVPLLLHAGAVARQGMAVLLPNASHAGKTTLTLALAARGWLPLTDDICPLVEVDGELVALECRRCCHVRMPSQDLLESLGVALEGPLGGLNLYRPQQWGKPAPVRGIVIPRYQAEAPTHLEPITQAECLAQLAAMIFADTTRPALERRTAARLATRVPGFTLTYSSLGEALDAFGLLESQLEAVHVPGER